AVMAVLVVLCVLPVRVDALVDVLAQSVGRDARNPHHDDVEGRLRVGLGGREERRRDHGSRRAALLRACDTGNGQSEREGCRHDDRSSAAAPTPQGTRARLALRAPAPECARSSPTRTGSISSHLPLLLPTAHSARAADQKLLVGGNYGGA